MTITSLIIPICVLIILYALIHPVRTFRSIIKVFIFFMAGVIALAFIGIFIGQLVTYIMNLF